MFMIFTSLLALTAYLTTPSFWPIVNHLPHSSPVKLLLQICSNR
ncbi:hypothetical protein V6Z11_D12G274800 [Gossypium hirsutum]